MNDYQKHAHLYAQHGLTGTGYLAFKYVPMLIKKYAQGNLVLDYGCGAGRSTRFLKSLDLAVTGVDISEDMLHQARKISPDISFNLIESAHIAVGENTYDIVFSSLVLFEIATKAELLNVFQEIHRVLKPDGIFIAVTGSTAMYSHKWLSLDADFAENKHLTSGSIAKVKLKDAGLILEDYFWTDEDYAQCIAQSHFGLLEKLYPLGDSADGYPWITETSQSPYVVYVLSKEGIDKK